VGRGRERFRAEFERLAALRYAAVVVEGSMGAIMKGRRYGRITPAHALGTMGSWAMEYRVPVFYCDGRSQAKWYIHTLLRLAAEKAERPDARCWTRPDDIYLPEADGGR
jgi:hypothetical protein